MVEYFLPWDFFANKGNCNKEILDLIECFIDTKIPLMRADWEKIFESLAGNFLVSDDGDFLELAHYSYADDIYKQSDIFVTLNIKKRFIL